MERRTRDPRGVAGRSIGRRESTRAAIVRGARASFCASGYAATAVEDIIRAAKISRATFYAHFENKHAVLATVIAEVEPQLLEIYDELGPIRAVTLESLHAWLRRLTDFFAQHRDILQIWGDAINDREFTRSLQGLGNRMADRLGLTLPSAEALERAEDREEVFLSVFFLAQVGQFCTLTLASGWNVDQNAAITVMAKMLYRSVIAVLGERGNMQASIQASNLPTE